jgi:DNA topoisomerase-1
VRGNGNSYNAATASEPPQSARAAGLRYVSDDDPGLRRRRSRGGFRYIGPDGRAAPRHVLARIRALAIPPAWEDVWICADEHGHLQATGRDAKGRKQYRYHARWREARDETKYGRVSAFAAALARLRRRVARDLQLPGLPRDKAIATIVRLLETTFMRIGNEQYARENESFGLTTLRGHQVRVRAGRLHFRFRGKSGVHHSIELSDRALAAIVRRMQDLPGEELFQYVDDAGETRTIESADVNAYLKEATGEAFTSKDFRTWAGTVLAIEALRAAEPPVSSAHANRNVVRAVEYVSSRLGNTKAVCRKCYIHPGVMERYLDGTFASIVRGRTDEGAVVPLVDATRRSVAARARRSGADGRSLAGVLKASLGRRRLQRRDARGEAYSRRQA